MVALAALLFSQAPAGQGRTEFFVQIADTQFGTYTGDKDFVQETANYEFAVANINRLRPAFVVVCGDLINKTGDAAQTAEYLRITATIDPTIPVHAVAGNHDVGNEPTPASLASYRARFGPDYYSFRHGSVYGIVLDSSLISAPGKVLADANAQETWLKAEFEKAKQSGAPHVVIFQHISLFLEKPDEPAQYFNIPMEARRRYLDLLKASGVRYVFAGHYHRNASGRDGDLEMITTGPISRPLGDDPNGMRIVMVRERTLEHTYYGLGSIPNQFPPAPVRARPDP